MDEQRQRPTYGRKAIILLAVLITAGLMGNICTLNLFTGFNYLFGSIAVLLVVSLFGPWWGLLAGLVASSWTIVLFGHPYAMVWLCAEPLFVAWLLKRGRTRNIILYDALYWALLGTPLVWLFFRHVMQAPLLGTVAALLMYAVIGIANALAASLLLVYVPRLTAIVRGAEQRSIPIHNLIFNLMMAVVVVPALAVMIIHGRDAERRYLQGLHAGLEENSRTALYETSPSLPLAPYQQLLLEDHIKSLLVLLVLNMLALTVSVYISRRLVAPLTRLSQVTSDLPERLLHDRVVAWPESMVSEIDHLIANFRAMAVALGQRFQEISFDKETLEQRVEERTRELTWINEELQKEIAEHTVTEKQRDRLMNELEQKNKDLEGIIYVASHDLRSPLVNVQGFSRKLAKNCAELERIIDDLGLEEQQRERLEPLIRESIPKSLGFITGSVEKMDGLLTGLLRLSRMGRAAICFETLDMRAILTKIVSSMTFQIEATGSRVELGDLAPCLADALQVTQIFSNLLDNAVKYRSPLRPLRVRVFSEETGEGVRYCVEDNGIGIPPDQQDNVWEIFYRLNPQESQGEGLGLTTARRIVDRLGGSIRVESALDSGSRFYVVLPAPPEYGRAQGEKGEGQP